MYKINDILIQQVRIINMTLRREIPDRSETWSPVCGTASLGHLRKLPATAGTRPFGRLDIQMTPGSHQELDLDPDW